MPQWVPNTIMKEEREHILTRLLVAAVTQVKKKDGDALIGKFQHEGGWNITFKIEDVEVDIKKVMETWEEHLDKEVLKKASELLREKINGILDPLAETLDDLRRGVVRKAGEKLGVDLKEDE